MISGKTFCECNHGLTRVDCDIREKFCVILSKNDCFRAFFLFEENADFAKIHLCRAIRTVWVGAKLADGLAQLLAGDALRVVVNVGDDFTHLSLGISPDIDTVLYTLAGFAHPVQGWGRNGESWGVMQELKQLGAPDWFALGDRDIALHLVRQTVDGGRCHAHRGDAGAGGQDGRRDAHPARDQ